MMRAIGTIAERVAINESAIRDANEQIEKAVEKVVPSPGPMPFICECCDPECTRIARLTLAEYEKVRSSSTWFLVVVGHESTYVDGVEIAEVAARHERYSVMNKVGLTGDLAEVLDPRGQNGH